jgi:hypothetical protein
VIAVYLHGVRRQFDVVKHGFELGRELRTTFTFEFGEHASFSIVIGRLIVKEALCQVSPIISFEHVFLCDESEQADGFI